LIQPRHTRLLKVRTLQQFRRVITSSALEGGFDLVRATGVIVPTRSAAAELRRSLERAALRGGGAIVLPDLLTRDEWYARMRASLPDPPRLLSALERQVIMAAAAEEAVRGGMEPPFRLRPGLTAEMLAFYDELRRRDQTVSRFEALLTDRLAPSVEDRGAERMLQQTQFLAAAFRAYEDRVRESGGADEHALRARLLSDAGARPVRRLIVTVGDRGCDPPGLWIADFDLMARLPLVASIDIVATMTMLDAGWYERLRDAMPGIEEVEPDAGEAAPEPVLLVPPRDQDRLHFVVRDREDELAAIARRLKASRRGEGGIDLDRHAVVFRRPLPYLYLARTVFADAGIPCQASDALPLAAEPYAAAVDLVIAAVTSGFTRASIVALLRSPFFSFSADDLPPGSIRELDRRLSEAGYLGDLEAFRGMLEDVPDDSAARPAARAAERLAERLARFVPARRASEYLRDLWSLLVEIERPRRLAHRSERDDRARGAILDAAAALATAHAAHHDPETTFAECATRLHRWIETQTFRPRTGSGGVHLVDADAAPFGDYDVIHIVGLIERDWPEPASGNVFYAPRLLAALGWTAEPDRIAAARAAFRDLLRLPHRAVTCSSMTLEDEAIVESSPFLDELAASGLARVHDMPARSRIFVHEALASAPVVPDVVEGPGAAWLALRQSRGVSAAERFKGVARGHSPGEHSVSSVERYLECPFKYFAIHVLGLEEDPEDEDVMSPRARGLFIHQVFQAFFAEWSQRGGAITADRLDEARALFSTVAERFLATLRPVEAALERTRLLGSPVAAGLADAVFRMEAERPAPVVERLLEFAVRGELDVEHDDVRARVRLRGVADRIDVLGDHTLRVFDYKTGRAPLARRALQLPLYSLCASRQLEARDGCEWRVAEAAYIAFGGPRTVVPMSGRGSNEDAMADARGRLGAAIVGIGRGEFFVQPLEPFRCTYCAYAGVCRKDYVGDE
jgi:RecB family exonuclease